MIILNLVVGSADLLTCGKVYKKISCLNFRTEGVENIVGEVLKLTQTNDPLQCLAEMHGAVNKLDVSVKFLF